MMTPKYKRLEIEWKHFAVGDATCERCGKTGDTLHAVVEELQREFMPAGAKISLTETLLDKTRIAESNEIRMNGALLEDLLAAGIVLTDCPSCGTLAGKAPAAGRSKLEMTGTRMCRNGRSKKLRIRCLEYPPKSVAQMENKEQIR
jgi:hypothetical protein